MLSQATHTGSAMHDDVPRYRVAHTSSSLGSRCVLWLGEGLSMSSPNDPVLCCPLPYRDAPVFVQVVSPPLGWSPLSSFLVIWSPSGDTRGPSVVFEAVDMPCPGPFHFSHSVDYIYSCVYTRANLLRAKYIPGYFSSGQIRVASTPHA